MNYDNPTELSQLFDLVKLILKERGVPEISNILRNARINIIDTVDTTFLGGDIAYTIQIVVEAKKYSSYNKHQIDIFESNISACLNEITKTDECVSFSTKITPSLILNQVNHIENDSHPEIKEIRQKIDTIKNIMVSVATGGDRIQVVNERYQALNNTVRSMCDKLNIIYNNPFDSLWDWFGKWKADFRTYQERREYISELFSPMFASLDVYKLTNVEVLIQLDDWTRIKRTVAKIKSDSASAQNEEDFQSIGLLCRDVLISLAQAVYDPIIYGDKDEEGKSIGKADAVRMIGNYFNVKLKGKQTKELRDYAKASNAIANQLTHKRTATRTDMLLTMSSTIALINFIGILEDKM